MDYHSNGNGINGMNGSSRHSADGPSTPTHSGNGHSNGEGNRYALSAHRNVVKPLGSNFGASGSATTSTPKSVISSLTSACNNSPVLSFTRGVLRASRKKIRPLFSTFSTSSNTGYYRFESPSSSLNAYYPQESFNGPILKMITCTESPPRSLDVLKRSKRFCFLLFGCGCLIIFKLRHDSFPL